MDFLDIWPHVEGTVYKLAKNVRNKSNTLKKINFSIFRQVASLRVWLCQRLMSHLDHREKCVLNKNAPGHTGGQCTFISIALRPSFSPANTFLCVGFCENCNATLNFIQKDNFLIT